MASLARYLRRQVQWTATGDPVEPYASMSGAHEWRLRINDFPEEHLYSLIVDGTEVSGFDDWPESWVRPSAENSVVFRVRESDLLSKRLGELTREFERKMILAALERAEGNRRVVADRLGIRPASLTRKLRVHKAG